MSYPTSVDETAPVVTEHTITIDAPRSLVWEVHLDVDEWSRWNADITGSSTPAPLAPGVTFTWSTFGLDVPSTVFLVEAPHTIRWGGVTAGISGIHQWWFDERGPDQTHVTTRESWSGDPVAADVERARRDLDHSLDAWLQALRSECETRSSSAT